jgi:hypothetical protein
MGEILPQIVPRCIGVEQIVAVGERRLTVVKVYRRSTIYLGNLEVYRWPTVSGGT